MKTKTRLHFNIAAVLLWAAVIPIVISLYIWFPHKWLEVFGVTLSVGHIWSILTSHLRAAAVSYREHKAQHHIHESVSKINSIPSQATDRECETLSVWA